MDIAKSQKLQRLRRQSQFYDSSTSESQQQTPFWLEVLNRSWNLLTNSARVSRQESTSFRYQVFALLLITIALLLSFVNYSLITNQGSIVDQQKAAIAADDRNYIWTDLTKVEQVRDSLQIEIAPVNWQVLESEKEARLQQAVEQASQSQLPEEILSTELAKVTVEAGDSLWAIANRNDTTVEQIKQLNGLGQNTVLRQGQVLLVPRSEAGL